MFAQEEAISKKKRRSSRLHGYSCPIFRKIVIYDNEIQIDFFLKNDLCDRKITIFLILFI